MRRWTNLALVAATIGVLAGCGSSSSGSSSASASKASFCADNAKLDKNTNSASNLGQLVKVLKSNEGTIKDFGQTAPSAIKAQAEILINAAEKGINSGSTAGFNQKFADAGKAVDSYCAKK
jgi:basic membrane lipoprotein Med (substrate-binding protein (PBP1-ABC) superfamily)